MLARYQAINDCRDRYPVRMMCRCLRVSASGYYAWRSRPLSQHAQANAVLLARICEIHTASGGVMGAPSIWEQLVYEGYRCSPNRVERLMHTHQLRGVQQKKAWGKKRSRPRPDDVQNHLARDFKAPAPNRKWVSDITYIRTAQRWLYLCVIIDLYSGLVIGWAMQAQQDKTLVIKAIAMAMGRARPIGPVVFHSDRGSQYTSYACQRYLKENHLLSSMSEVGSCADNAAAESFFGLLKRERVYLKRYLTHQQARTDVFDYIERFHNPRRRRKLALRKAGILPLT